MQTLREPLIATLAGLTIGLLWWLAYTPLAMAGWAVVGLHVVGSLAIYGLFRLLGWDRLAPILTALVGGLLLAPLMLVPFHRSGSLGGPTGAIADVVVVALVVLAAGRLGHMMALRPQLGGRIAVVVVGLMGLLTTVAASRIPSDDQLPSALTHEEVLFPYGPVLVYGIDGGDWQVLEPLMASGELPHLQALLERGRGGKLVSHEPMASPVVWTTLFSGVEPPTHGVDSWLRSDSRSRRVAMLWDALDAQSRSTLTVNVPGSWPPPSLKHGDLVVGFPMPGLTSGDTSHLVGSVITEAGSHSVPVSSPEIHARFQVGPLPLSNQLLDTLHRERLLPVAGHELELQVQSTAQGVNVATNASWDLDLRVGETSDWLAVPGGDVTVWVQLHLLSAEPLQLFVGPSYQDPQQPRHAISSGLDETELSLLGGDTPYVVEGIGWTAHRDERIAHLVPRLLLETQDRQLDFAVAMLKRGTPDLTSVVFTATDRIQHPYWSLHQPGLYEGVWAPSANIAGQDYVVEAYKKADEGLGRLLAELPPHTTVFVVSDHGVSDADPKHKKEYGEAGHRLDGIWLAAGPDITASTQAEELDVVDLVPSVLACLGAPLAEDFEGQPGSFCTAPKQTVPTYTGAAGSGAGSAGDDQIDQIKSLGYMED
jgi:hypothetical protein